MTRNFFHCVILSLFLGGFSILSSGCFNEHRPAPVLNGWYQPGAASNFYVVRHGDTIYSIAFAFGIDYRALVEANQLTPPYVISAGQRLRMTHKPAGRHAQTVLQPKSRYELFSRPIEHAQPTESLAQSPAWQRPTHGRLIQRFSRNPSGHPGISIAGQLGEPIRAAANGVVVYSGDGVRGYGNLIIIKHNDSYLSAYAFNQQNLVGVGEYVRAGQVIARMGQDDAGRTLLYFEIRQNGVPIDPLRFL